MITTRVQRALVWVVVAVALASGRASAADPSNPYESDLPATPVGAIDEAVFKRFAVLEVQPVLCSDAVFLRRAYLDLTGTLPTAAEARAFLEDDDRSHKRARLVDRLLASDAYADYWSMRWGDILRIKAEFPVNLWPNAAQAYHRWVRASLAENKPYDRFARELLCSSGSNFRVGPVNFYRAVQNRTPEGIAGAVALTFMGARVDAWPRESVKGMAVFFSQVGYKPTREWKEQIVYWDPLGDGAKLVTSSVPPEFPAASASAKARIVASEPKLPQPAPLLAAFPDGKRVSIPPSRDPRGVFADWLIDPRNPWFTKAVVNRMWYWMLGRGVIHEPDDMRSSNPPSNPELLACLEQEMIAGHYDMKRLLRLIATSTTYQLSSIPHSRDPKAEALFASYSPRRLDAEVLIDAIDTITDTSDLYTSPIPEPFTYIPPEKAAVAIADGSITSQFLALFGRSARATGLESERNNKPMPGQSLHMLNSSHIQDKIERGAGLRAIFAKKHELSEVVDELYLTVLSRFPTPAEREVVSKHARAESAGEFFLKVDLPWALINSAEFRYRH